MQRLFQPADKEQPQAQEPIYVKYYGLMQAVARTYFPVKEDAEDLVQESILKIIEKGASVDLSDERRAKSFCLVLLRHTALDKLRRNKTEQRYAQTLADESTSATEADFTIDRDVVDCVVAAIGKMSDIYRTVCTLKYVNDLTEKEIAAVLDLPQTTVNQRIQRGKQQLRNALREAKLHE